jgi:hypothetical protein
VYLTTSNGAYKIDVSGNELVKDTVPVDRKQLDWDLLYCDEATGNTRFIRRYKDNNQTVAFFAISGRDKRQVKMLKEITNEARKQAVSAYVNDANRLNIYLASIGVNIVTASNGAELRLARKAKDKTDIVESNFVLPFYAVLKSVNDSIFLFAHDIDSMFVYDKDGNLTRNTRINYHRLKTWGNELIVNEEKTCVYARFTDNAKTTIAEIDLQTGTIKSSVITIPQAFPAKIRIRKDTIYFLAKQKDRTGYTVYSAKLHPAAR